jgi:tetratricopeptide (TPR) repeat protein
VTKQDERQRLRRRLQDYALQLSSSNRWEEAVEINQQILELGEDPTTYNCLGKAYKEQGLYQDAQQAYQQTLRLNPTNTIARKNLTCLDALMGLKVHHDHERNNRLPIDLRIFVTEAGKTTVTTLVDVTRSPIVMALSAAEKVELSVSGRNVLVHDMDGEYLGRLEPRIGQRLAELISGGNRYIGVIVQTDTHQVRLLIREVFQDPSQRLRISFPGRLGDTMGLYGYTQSLDYDYGSDEMLDEEETPDEPEETETEYMGNEEEEELGLDTIEKDMGDDDDNIEE